MSSGESSKGTSSHTLSSLSFHSWAAGHISTCFLVSLLGTCAEGQALACEHFTQLTILGSAWHPAGNRATCVERR